MAEREWIDDGHKVRMLIGREGLEVKIVCPHPHRNVPDDSRCAWYRPKGSGPFWCGLASELSECGTAEFLWDWFVVIEIAEAVPVTGDIAMEWAVSHCEDDAPEVLWRPVLAAADASPRTDQTKEDR